MTTLRELHKKLKIKQTLDNYVRNTNKKYKYNLVADEILGEGLAKLIELNTQGKLGRHAQQIAYINHNLSLQRQKEQIIDIVDKMSLLKQDFDGAFTWIKENVSMPFDFDGEQQFISDLKQLVKINALKFGKIYEGVLN